MLNNERTYAHWIYDDEDDCFICSRCDKSTVNNYRGDAPTCPNCGAIIIENDTKSCKDCLYYALLCRDTLQEDELVMCKYFKDKSDYVKVVRCRKCMYANDDGTICRYNVIRSTEPTNYCKYGAKGDD